jgi:signal transduction histidine kinase/ligand-binding sensor domain-containing protein/DNA-binding response OmpR family regulator
MKTSKLIASLLFIILILGGALHGSSAQSYSYEIQTIPLKGDFINFSGLCFMQDSDGFMWFGSTEGMYRYQGTSVKVYRHDPDNENSLTDNFVYDLYEDSEGVIWIGTQDGLNRFDKYTESFRHFKHDYEDSTSILWNHIYKITEDKNNNLWIATSRGFSLFDRETEAFRNYQIRREESEAIKKSHQIFNLTPGDEEHLWLNSGKGVYRFYIPSGIFEKIKGIEKDFTWEVYKDQSGRYWFINYRGLYLYDMEQQTYKRFFIRSKYSNKPESQNIRALLEDRHGNIWIRTFGGIYCYNQQLELKYTLEHPEMYPETYRNQDLTKELFVSNTGSIWFYTPDAINQIIPKGLNFRIYDFNRLISFWINCIYPENRDQIWYGTLDGINSLDRRRNIIKLHYGDTILKTGFPHQALTMCPARNGTLWIGMWTAGLFRMIKSEKGGMHLRSHRPESTDCIGLIQSGLYNITNIFEDNRGRLWIRSGGYRFLHYYDTLQNKVVRLVDNPSAKNSLPERRGVIRYQTGSDTLWSISSSGIYKIILPLIEISVDKVMPTDVIKFRLFDEDSQEIGIPNVHQSYMDNSGNIWLATSRQGLIKIFGDRIPGMAANAYRMKSYSIREGLPTVEVRSILPDGKDKLWMGTKNGLSKLHIPSETFTNYYVRHGLPTNEFQRGSAATGEDGELFFGTIAGMISFFPDSVHINQHIAPVMITGMSINNQSLHTGNNSILNNSISYTDKIELHHNQNNISIEYAILNYDNPELNQYRYKLGGFNDDWFYAGNRTKVDFTNLDPGKYTFHVSGSNNDGIWNEAGTSLQITIRPPPWQTWYAYLVYGLFLTGIIIWYNRFLQNRTRLRLAVEIEKFEKEKMVAVDQMKSRFFTNISHEFRTPLTLILGPLEKLDTKKSGEFPFSRDLVVIMRRNARRLLRLINQLLDLSKLETGGIRLQVSENDMIDFIRTLVLSFLSLAENKRIEYEYDLPDSTECVYYDQDKLEKIFTNLVSNAFKFTPALGRVSIKVQFVTSPEQESPHAIEIKVSDSGKGIPQDQIDKIFDRFYQVRDSVTGETEGTGVGLALTKELVDLYRGELSVESSVGLGSIFTVRLPVSKEQFNNGEIVITQEKATLESVESYIEHKEPEEAMMEVNHTLRKSETDPVILIVEDNADLRNYISSTLGSSYQILMAENGQQGLDRAIDSIPDLIISDVMMPVIDGIEMCGQLKQNKRTNHIPVILLTAKADSQSKMEGLTTGADDYIIKPFNVEELLVRVKNLIQQRQKLKEKFMQEFILEPEDQRHISPQDKLLQEIIDLLNHNLDKPDFSINQMSCELNMSRSQLYRKVSALTGLSPTDLLRNIRLRNAATLFNSGQDNVSQVMYQVGFSNHSYFARCFRELFLVNPSEYINRRKS